MEDLGRIYRTLGNSLQLTESDILVTGYVVH